MADTRQKWVSLRSKCRLVKRQNMQCCIVQISPTRLAAIKLRVDLVGIVKQGFINSYLIQSQPWQGWHSVVYYTSTAWPDPSWKLRVNTKQGRTGISPADVHFTTQINLWNVVFFHEMNGTKLAQFVWAVFTWFISDSPPSSPSSSSSPLSKS